jgi:hypothetical protein
VNSVTMPARTNVPAHADPAHDAAQAGPQVLVQVGTAQPALAAVDRLTVDQRLPDRLWVGHEQVRPHVGGGHGPPDGEQGDK